MTKDKLTSQLNTQDCLAMDSYVSAQLKKEKNVRTEHKFWVKRKSSFFYKLHANRALKIIYYFYLVTNSITICWVICA